MTSNIRDDVLAHFGIDTNEFQHAGVKGMKWGVRRARGADGRVTSKVISNDHLESRQLGAKKQSALSNKELETVNRRLQLERTNKELQSRGALQKIKVGTSIAGTILAVGTTITSAYNFTQSPAGKAIIESIKKANTAT